MSRNILIGITLVQHFKRLLADKLWGNWRLVLVGPSFFFLCSGTLNAQNTWQDSTGDNNWFNSLNWIPGLPDANSVVVINNGTTAQVASAGAVANSLRVGAATEGGAALPGSTLQLLSGGTLAVSTSGSVVIGSEGTLQFSGGGNSGGTLTSGPTIVDDGNILFDGPLDHFLSAAVSGTGQITMAGTGTLSLTGTNNYTGGTKISSGTVVIGDGGTLPGPVADNGTLTFDLSGPLTVPGNITGTGSVTQIGTGTTILSGNNTYTGGTTVSAGTLEAGSLNGFSPGSAFTVNSILDLHGFNNTIGSLSGNGVVLNNGDGAALITIGNDNTSTTFNGVLEDGTSVLGLTKTGSGTLTLTGTNFYSDGTNIVSGTLQLGNGGTTGSITGDVVNNGVLAFDRSDTLTFTGVITGTGEVAQMGSGTTILAGDNTYSGGTTISAGTLQLGNGGTTGSITGNVTNNGNLAFDRSDTLTFVGDISGAGSVNQTGSGTTILAGNDTYTGATTVSAGTLQAGSANGFSQGSAFTVNSILDVHGFNSSIGSLSGTGTVLNNGPAAASLTVGNDNTSTTFNGTLADGTSILALVKTGTGTLALPGVNTYTGSTTINVGSLIVDGSIASAETVVNPGGLLGGHGTIGGNLANNGTVGQASSPGTLTVSGNYTQSAGATLRVGVGGLAPGQFDVLAVNGHATVGGSLQFVRLGGFNLQPGDQVTFLTAKNGVSGTFGNVQNGLIGTGTIVQVEVTSLANSVVLEGTQGSFANTPGVATTPNNLAVAKALDSARGDPREAALFAFLNSEPLANLPHDLTLIAPTQNSSLNATAVSVGKVQLSNVGARLANIRGGSTGFSSAGFSVGGATSFGEGFEGVTGPEGKSGPAVFAPTPSNRWGVFLTGLGEFTGVDSTTDAAGYDVDTGGLTFGVDYRVTPNIAIGFTGGYAHTNVSPDGGGRIDVNGGKLGIYATIFGNGFYLDAAATGGPSSYDSHRAGLQGTANGSTDGVDFNALIAGGYDWQHGNLTIGPTASFQYGYIGLDSFSETGSLAALKFPDQNTESERSAFGAKATYEWKIGKITLIPQVSAAWQHEFGATAYSVVAGFATGAGNNFTVTGPDIGRDSLLVGAGATVILSERVSTYLFYDGEVARTNYQSHNVSGGVRISF
jgi:autotransporter-associated beta strand protein